MAGVAMLRSVDYFRICRKRIQRIPVTSQAVAHPHGHILVHDIHCLNFTVAGLTNNPGLDVGSVIEIDVVRQRMNPHPLKGFPGLVQSGKLQNVRAVRFGNAVAVHAFLHCRDSGLSRFGSAAMAVSAGNAQGSRVELMGIGYRLHRRIAPHKTVGLREPANAGNRPKYRYKSDG